MRETHTIDAKGQRLGRLATRIATLLRGKHKPSFQPHIDCGDIVHVYNTGRIRLTGNKWRDKTYWRHSGYPGGIRSRTAEEWHAIDPTALVRHAVRGMLPENKLRASMLRRLYLHPEEIKDAKETKTP